MHRMKGSDSNFGERERLERWPKLTLPLDARKRATHEVLMWNICRLQGAIIIGKPTTIAIRGRGREGRISSDGMPFGSIHK